jgi:dynein heavy chain
MPGPRGGHTSAMLTEQEMLLIYGGWSNSSQYSDIWLYDINNNCWVDPELSHEIPRCNFLNKTYMQNYISLKY